MDTRICESMWSPPQPGASTVLEPGGCMDVLLAARRPMQRRTRLLLATMRFRLSFSILLAVLALTALPTVAAASWSQHAVFQDDHNLLERGDAARERTLDELRALGVDVVKAQLSWSEVAPTGRRRPADFVPADPAQYPGWARYDALVRDVQARGMSVMLALSPPYPGWAAARRGGRVG